MKQELRNRMIKKRNQLREEIRRAKSHELLESLQPYLLAAHRVGIYKSFASEVSTDEIISFLLKNKKLVAVPKCEQAGIMNFYQIDETTKFQINVMGIKEPISDHLISSNRIDLMIIPMVGFYKNQRLGYGGGYYDRYLTACPAFKIGLAFAMQEVKFTSESYDISMDLIISA